MKIKIEYLAESRQASLSTDELGKAWTAIQRACQDHADSDSITSFDRQIIFPWWAFLLAKEAIGYHIAKNKAEVEFSESAKTLLQQAAERQQLYKQASHAEKLSIDSIYKKLREQGFSWQLTQEQENNVTKLGSLPAAATFSVPGAGKTAEALAYYCCRKKDQNRLLVVCPKNAFAVWEEHVSNIFSNRDISVARLTGGALNIKSILAEDPDISLITYQQLPFVSSIISDYLTKHKVFMFLDESHRMKRGDTGVIGSTLLSMAHLPDAKCIMSGTPLPNSINDLIPQFRFLYPEIPTSDENVKDLIKPVYVRTTKSQLKIPGIQRIFTKINLSPAQRELYQLLCSEIAREASGLSVIDRRKLRSLGKSALRLIQLVSNPALLARKLDFEHKRLLSSVLAEGDSPKLEYITTRARELAGQGRKTIIWSSFVGNVELISARLFDLGADFIHGGVEAGSEDEENTREQKIKRFHDDDNAYVLVANPAACSEGISLHKVCHHAIYLDRNYNAAQYLQSEDRIHRLGLKPHEKTVVEILISPETIDESVMTRLVSKIKVMGDILDDPDLNVDHYDLDNDNEFDVADAAEFIRHIKSEANPQ